MFKKFLMTTALAFPLALSGEASAQPAAKKPNIVVIMADDVGIWNISAYHRGMMGGSTPNIDRIAKEGALFTDYYAQQSCTAGRAAFILGQTPFRTGLLKVGMPADISVMRLLEGRWTLEDGDGVKVKTRRMLQPEFVVRGSKMYDADSPLLPELEKAA